MIRSAKSFDLSSAIGFNSTKISKASSTDALSSAQPIAQATSLLQNVLQNEHARQSPPDALVELSALIRIPIPLDQSETIYYRYQSTIQEFLEHTQLKLTHYFDSVAQAKSIHISEMSPGFIALRMDDAAIKAIAEKAFTDKSYAKDYPRDGCYARAELAALHLDTSGNSAGKIFVTEADLVLQHPSLQNVAWKYHVAAAAVSKEDHQLWVIDPCVSQKPILLHNWLEKFVVSDSVKLTFTHSKYQYYQSNNFNHSYETETERVRKAKASLDFLAQNGYAPNQSESSFGHYIPISEDQEMYDQLLLDLAVSDDSNTDSSLNINKSPSTKK